MSDDDKYAVIIQFKGFGAVPEEIDPFINMSIKNGVLSIYNGYAQYEYQLGIIDNIIFRKLEVNP